MISITPEPCVLAIVIHATGTADDAMTGEGGDPGGPKEEPRQHAAARKGRSTKADNIRAAAMAPTEPERETYPISSLGNAFGMENGMPNRQPHPEHMPDGLDHIGLSNARREVAKFKQTDENHKTC